MPSSSCDKNEPIWFPLWGSECLKNDKIGNLGWPSIETIFGGKDSGFYEFSWVNFKIALYFLITEKIEIFFAENQLVSPDFVLILAWSLLAVYFISASFGKPGGQKKKKIIMSRSQSFTVIYFWSFPKSKPVSGDTGHDFEVRSIQNLDTLVLTSK